MLCQKKVVPITINMGKLRFASSQMYGCSLNFLSTNLTDVKHVDVRKTVANILLASANSLQTANK